MSRTRNAPVHAPVAGRSAPRRSFARRAPGWWVSAAAIPSSVAALIVAAPAPLAGQVGFVVEGRVTELGGSSVANAIVSLEGQRPVLTAANGAFRYESVGAGTRTLRVEGFGYAPTERTLVVDRDTVVTIELDFAPFVLDSLVVSPRAIDIRGRVREPSRQVPLSDVDVLTSQGETVRTNRRGRFEVDGWAGQPVLLQIRAFGFLPVDTVVASDDDEDLDFVLEPDPLAQRMIEVGIRRIEERAGGRRAITMPPIDRESLLRWNGYTLAEVLRLEYPRRGGAFGCVVFNEQPLTPEMAPAMLETTIARDVERLEFLFDGAMLRVYTRAFMRTLIGASRELRPASYVATLGEPLCR